MTTNTDEIRIDYVDYGVQGEYGFFGKVVARSYVGDLTEAEISKEISEVMELMGRHVVPVRVEYVHALDLDRP